MFLGAAAALLLIALVSPVGTMANHYLLSAHLAQALVLMGVVPPLLLLALSPGPAGAGSPRRWPPACHRVATIMVHPAVAIVVLNAVFLGWHVAPLFDASLNHESVWELQEATVLGASVLFWWPIVHPGGRPGRVMGDLLTLGYILLATIPQTFAGLILALAGHPLYAPYAAAPRVAGIGVMTDQVVAGACLALVSKIALFTAFSIIFMRLLDPGRDPDMDEEGGGGGGGRRGDAPLPIPSGAPAWLILLRNGHTTEEPATRRRSTRAERHSALR